MLVLRKSLCFTSKKRTFLLFVKHFGCLKDIISETRFTDAAEHDRRVTAAGLCYALCIRIFVHLYTSAFVYLYICPAGRSKGVI